MPERPFSRPRPHVNQLSAAINPFPPQKLDLFIRPSLTFYPPESLLCSGSKEAVCLLQADRLHHAEHSRARGKFGEKSPALIPLRGGRALCCSGWGGWHRKERRIPLDMIWSNTEVHKSHLVKWHLKLSLDFMVQRHTHVCSISSSLTAQREEDAVGLQASEVWWSKLYK